MEDLYRRLEEIKQPKRREILLKEKDIAFLSRDLAKVKCDVPLDFHWDQSHYAGPTEKLQPLFEELEFQNLMKKFAFKPKAETSFNKGTYEAVTTPKRLKEVAQELKSAKEICVDTETTSLAIHDANLVGISISAQSERAYYFPVGHCEVGQSTLLPNQLSLTEVAEALKPVFADEKIAKIGQNLKYDMQILCRAGIALKGIASDTLLASYLLDPDQPHNLDSLTLRLLGHKNISYDEVTGTGKQQISFAEVAIEKATEYSGEDADVTMRLHQKMVPALIEQRLKRLYDDVEIPLISCLAEMEYVGVRVDQPRLQKMGSDLAEEIEQTQNQIYEIAGGPFNINSPKQLSVLLFEKLKLRVVRKTKTGYSTDESVLIELSSEHEVCRRIVRFRELMKLKSTYVEGLLSQVHPATQRVHTNYNQTVAATGRLSSSNPNLQNIPTTNEAKYDLRSVFIPADGCELFSADYSQVELRLLADMSGDPELMRAFSNNEDVHDFTGRLIFGVAEITPEQRKIAKTINFGVIYGQTPFGLSKQLGISPSEAKTFIELYFQRYPGIQSFMQHLREEARRVGYASTKLGRRRFLPDLNSKNRMQREMAERAAINAPLQGTAADMIKVAMVQLHQKFSEQGLNARMILQVHDELVFEVPKSEHAIVEKLVVSEMEKALPLKVPLKVDIGWGKNWRECG